MRTLALFLVIVFQVIYLLQLGNTEGEGLGYGNSEEHSNNEEGKVEEEFASRCLLPHPLRDDVLAEEFESGILFDQSLRVEIRIDQRLLWPIRHRR